MATATQTQEKQTAWDRAVRKFGDQFQKLGLTVQDIPAAIVVHEVLGLALAVGWWSACYAVRPSHRMAGLARGFSQGQRGAQLQRAYSAAMAQATATVQRMSWLQKAPVNPARLTVSLAESIMVRAALKPVTFPFKIWASYKLVMLGKHLGAQLAEGSKQQAGSEQTKQQRKKRA